MVRMQLYLDDALHQRLLAVANRQGRTLSDLVRETVARAYGATVADERISTLEGIAALWRDRHDLGGTNAYVRRLRRDTHRSRRGG